MKYSRYLFTVALATNFSWTLAAANLPFSGGSNQDTVYSTWRENSSYENNAFLPSKSGHHLGVALHWNTNTTHISLAVVAKAEGWVGFGLAEAGGMKGADVVLFTAATQELTDTYVLDQLVTPIPDECQSWNLMNSSVRDGFIIFEATRLLDTQDLQDRAIINDTNTLIPPTRVIAAWGDTASPSYHGPDNNSKGAIRFFGDRNEDDVQQTMQVEAEGFFTVQARDYLIPSNETTYAYFCVSRQDMIDQGVPVDLELHIIGMDPIIDPRAAKHLHHFLVHGSESDHNSPECNRFHELIYVWARGELPLMLPSDVGIPLGLNSFISFSLQIHYDNPWGEEGQLDSSGVKLYWTSKKRPMDMGIIGLADPLVRMDQMPLNPSGSGKLVQHVFDCPSDCSTLFLSQPVTVLREALHMHRSGVSASNEQFRDGEVIRKGEVEYWDFDQQGTPVVVQNPFMIEPGDSFRTKCNYQPTDGEQVIGYGGREEMCIAYLFYYPRQLLSTGSWGPRLPVGCGFDYWFNPSCDASLVVTEDFTDRTQMLGANAFGTSPSTCHYVVTPSQAPVLRDPATPTPASSEGYSQLAIACWSLLFPVIAVINNIRQN